MTIPSQYTHNLNIAIVNQANNSDYDEFHIMEKIYAEMIKPHIFKSCISYESAEFEVQLHWKRTNITSLHKRFMGELFIVSPYSDKVLHDATKLVLTEIEKTIHPLRIAFHISRMLEHMYDQRMLIIQ